MCSSDLQLVAAYATLASESAFQALVARHVDLVYATALRQLGDRGLAEEVTQNVFIVLARKAPRLGGVETLAGWLHRTAILEAKARLRAELRRRQRERKASELTALQREGTSVLSSLVPLVDEALLHLRETDRLALILRFLEDRSLREIGALIGVDEDAARKRVSRALERMTAFFRARGVEIPAGSSAAALLASSASAAPPGLMATAAQLALAAGNAVGGLNVISYHLMALTKAQTTVICVMLAAAPLVWQRHAEAGLERQHATAAARLALAAQEAASIDAQTRAIRDATIRAEADTVNAENRLAQLTSVRDGRAPVPTYQWDDSSGLVRVPKQLLERLSISATADKRGKLTEQIKYALQLTDAEAEETQGALERFLAGYHATQRQQWRSVAPNPGDLGGRSPDEVRVFEITAVKDALGPLRETLFNELEAILGSERFSLFKRGLQHWMPLDEVYPGLNSSMAVFNFDRRELFYRPKPGDRHLGWGMSDLKGSSILAGMSLQEIPDFLRESLQDWIALAQSSPAEP